MDENKQQHKQFCVRFQCFKNLQEAKDLYIYFLTPKLKLIPSPQPSVMYSFQSVLMIQYMTMCGLFLGQGNTESRKNLKRKSNVLNRHYYSLQHQRTLFIQQISSCFSRCRFHAFSSITQLHQTIYRPHLTHNS